MKVLVLGSKEYPLGTSDDALPSGGIEVYVENFARHLSKNQEIIIITRHFKGAEKHERKDAVQIYRVPWLRGFFFRNISFNFAAFLKALRLEFDMIHANGPVATFFGIVISALKNKPLVAVPHGLALEQPQYGAAIRWFFSALEKFVYSRADCVVFLSEQEKDEFKRKLGFIPKVCEIIPTGIEIGKYEMAQAQRIKEEFGLKDELVITFVGRLIAVKGVEYLIEAITKLEKNNFRVLIVGDGPERQALEIKVRESGMKEKIIFTGQRSDVPEILAASDIFVLPSVSEGLPMALLEAMASACACVVTDIGLAAKQEETALVVPPRDSEALAEAIERLMSSEELRERLGGSARNEAAERYSWDKAVEKYAEIFNRLKAK